MKLIRYLGGGLLVVLLCGCSDVASDNTSASVSFLDSLPTLVLAEELRIGSVDDPDYGFSRIGDVHVDDRGRIYVFEGLDREIRVYGPDGRLFQRIGGSGEGPGEFRGTSVAFGVSRDTIWAMDWTFGAMGLMSLFDSTGSVLRSRSVEEVSLGADPFGFSNVVVAPVESAGSGLLMGDLNPFSTVQLADDPDGLRVPRVRFTLTGEVVDTVAWYTRELAGREPEILAVGSGSYLVPGVPFDEPLEIYLPDGRFVIDREYPDSPERHEFRVTRIGLAADTLYSRNYEYTPVAYPSDYLSGIAGRAARPGALTLFGSEGETTLLESFSRDSARAHARILDAMDHPEFQRPVGGERSFVPHKVGQDGSLWLQREWAGLDFIPWTVLDPAGRPVGQISLRGEDFRIAWIDGTQVWGVERDELGVPWLVRYRVSVESER